MSTQQKEIFQERAPGVLMLVFWSHSLFFIGCKCVHQSRCTTIAASDRRKNSSRACVYTSPGEQGRETGHKQTMWKIRACIVWFLPFWQILVYYWVPHGVCRLLQLCWLCGPFPSMLPTLFFRSCIDFITSFISSLYPLWSHWSFHKKTFNLFVWHVPHFWSMD